MAHRPKFGEQCWLYLVLAMTIFAVSAMAASEKGRYAVIIANKDYRFTDSARFADRDADAVAYMIRNALKTPKRNIRVFRNTTWADLRYIFGSSGQSGVISRSVQGENSELLVYFAGHGSKEAENGHINARPYILGTDSRPEDLKTTAYPVTLLKERLDDLLQSKLIKGRVTLVLETGFSGRSHAGELIKDRSAPALNLPLKPSLEKLGHSDRLLIVMAASSNQFAVWDETYRQSVFTDALVAGVFGEVVLSMTEASEEPRNDSEKEQLVRSDETRAEAASVNLSASFENCELNRAKIA